MSSNPWRSSSRGLQEKTAIAFGKGFVLEARMVGFTGVDAKIIKLLQDAAYVCQLEGKLVQTGLDAKFLTVADRFVPRLMQLLMAKPFKISFGEEIVTVPSVFDGQVELLFGVFASGRELEVRAQMPKTLRMLDTECTYVYCEGDVLRLSEVQKGIVRVLLSAQMGAGMPVAFRFDAQQGPRVISDLLPALERAGTVTLDGALAERITAVRSRCVRILTATTTSFSVRSHSCMAMKRSIRLRRRRLRARTKNAFCFCGMRRQSGVRLTCWRRLVSACRKGGSSSAVRSLFIAS